MPYLLQQLLSQSAQRWPDKEAVIFKDKCLSYRELDELSNRLANVLVRHGVRAGDRVGLYLNKSVESVVAVFGIMKAGAAYVPLDPSAPVKRVSFIIGNCTMKAVVTTRKKAAGLAPSLRDCPSLVCMICTDDGTGFAPDSLTPEALVPWSEVLASSTDPLPTETIEDDVGYILYTSGSTGEPKGVMISHRAALTFVNWACEYFDIQPADRLSNHAPLHFDLSIFDIFCGIKAGATVLPVPEELSVFPVEMARFIEEQRITIWYSVPSVLTRLVLHADLKKRRFPELSKILFAGEVFPRKYLHQLMSFIPNAGYYNLYGPTETNVCTYYQVKHVAPESDEPFPIGKACANTDVFAVTEQNQVAAAGEVGELYVRGPCLMTGYWGLPERTKQVVIADPLRPTWCDAKVYRTGDLVKQNADGDYLFLGRRDSMIKSRGFRIELGEIETVIYRHPKIEEAAVIAIPDEQVGNLIRAVVVTRDRGELGRGELETFCSDYLPKYMIPGGIEFRASLPKTSTGKVDKPTLVREQLCTRSV
jgi:amino acid adenylation domain-containing protein